MLLWHFAVAFTGTRLIPSPREVAVMMYDFSFGGIYDDAFSATILTHIWKSMERVYGGFFLAALIAIPLGLMIGRMKMLRQLLDPTINVLRPIPVTAWLPLSMIFFGLGPNAAIFLVFLGAFYPILLNTIFGVRSVDPRLFEAAAMLGCKGSAMFREVVLPASLPAIFSGLRIAHGFAWILIVVGEMTGVPDRPRLGDHGRPHAVAHRPGGDRHDRDRRLRLHHRPHHRDAQQPAAELEPPAPCVTHAPHLAIERVTKRFIVGNDEIEALARIDVTIDGRPVRLPDRRFRLRQVHPAAHHCRLRGADHRRGHGARPAGHRSGQRPRHGVPGLRAVSLDDGAAEHRLRPAPARTVEARRSRRSPTNSSGSSGSNALPTATRASSPAA